METQNSQQTESDEERKQRHEKILEVAKERFKLSQEFFREFRVEADEDMEFLSGKQWPSDIENQRIADGRPCLVINRLPNNVNQVANDQRQARPSLKVSPVDDKGDVETAKIRQGLIRHIEYDSNADAAYDTAGEYAIRTGLGFFRIITEYVSPLSFQMQAKIKQIADPNSVFMDPFSKEPDGSDQNYAFICDEVSPDEFENLYPNSELAKAGSWETYIEQSEGWISKDSVRVAEYFYREFRDATIWALSNGQVIEALKDGEVLPEGVAIQAQRRTKIPTIKWCKLTSCEVLEETEWPEATWIPVIPVYGSRYIVKGKQILEGIIRHAKDPQRMINYWTSSETETIALAPRAPFIGAEGQFAGFEHEWRDSNRRNFAYLQYRPVILEGGQMAPPPQRNAFEPPVAAITQAKMIASDDLKSTTGMFDAALGNRSNEQSGVAINQRKAQTQTSNFHFIDNLNRSIRHCGRILNELIIVVYDTAQAVRIIGDDDKEQVVRINEEFEKDGNRVTYNMTSGKYDVVMGTGPSFATKRQEATAHLTEVAKANPKVMELAGDVYFQNLDFHGADELAKRWRKTIPPQILEDEKDKDKQIPPQIQGQLQQQGQMIEQLTEQLNQAQDKLDNKLLELESKERIEFAKLEQEATIKLAELQSKEATFLLAQQVAELNSRMKLVHIDQPIESQNLTGEGPTGPMPSNEQQLTGELPPGQPTGEENGY